MAGKKAGAKKVAAAKPSWIRCTAITNCTLKDSNTSFVVNLDVTGDDGGAYYLQTTDPNDRPTIVKKVLSVIASHWPAYDWEFTADDSGSITDAR